MPTDPLDRLDELLPEGVRRVASRETLIPSIALRAKAVAQTKTGLVRADIGQIVGVDPAIEVPYGPPIGLDTLRASVAETYSLTYGLSLGARNVAVCTGAAEALSVLFRCFARDKVVALPRGHWENYANGVDLADGRVVVVDFFDAKGALDAEGLARRIRDDSVSVLVANFPCNPTGSVLDAAEAARLGAVARDTGVVVIADEVYARLRYDGNPPVTLLSHAPGHVVVVGSASKEYLLPGARVGWALSARAELTDVVLRKLIRANSASPNVIGQTRLLELVDRDLSDLRAGRPPGLVTRVRDEMRARRDRLLAVLDRHGFETIGRAAHRPEGTIFLMAALPAWWKGTDMAFAEAAMEQGVVSVIPGRAFGLEGSLRFSYGATSLADIDRLDANLAALRARLAGGA